MEKKHAQGRYYLTVGGAVGPIRLIFHNQKVKTCVHMCFKFEFLHTAKLASKDLLDIVMFSKMLHDCTNMLFFLSSVLYAKPFVA